MFGSRAAVAQAKALCADVEFSPMDATRADVEFTAEVCAIAVEEGATVINIPDTVGYTTPEEYARDFARLYTLAPELRTVELSVHCHDDLGLAVANSLAGVRAGARPLWRRRERPPARTPDGRCLEVQRISHSAAPPLVE